MIQQSLTVNYRLAPLRNLTLMGQLIERLLNRQPDLPGLGVYYGPSGYGKTRACLYGMNAYRAIHVEVRSTWTRKDLCGSILHEMGDRKGGTISRMVERIAEELGLSRRPLMIDEADNAVSRGMIETIRDIQMLSGGAVVLVGEELLPQKLEAFERVHNRVLKWTGAEPCQAEDAGLLAKIHCKGLTLASDLLEHVVKVSRGIARRVCVNLGNVAEAAAVAGVTAPDLAWAEAAQVEWYSGSAPARRL